MMDLSLIFITYRLRVLGTSQVRLVGWLYFQQLSLVEQFDRATGLVFVNVFSFS